MALVLARLRFGPAELYGGLAALGVGVGLSALLLRFRPLALAGVALVGAGALGGWSIPWLALLMPLGVLLAYLGWRPTLSEGEEAAFWGWALVWPALWLLLAWQVLPALYAFWLSLLRRFNFLGSTTFAGLENYQILLQDPLFWRAMGNTFWFALLTVPTGILLATFLAILLNEPLRGMGLYRTLFFLPYITPLTAAAVVWKWVYHPEFGLLNQLLHTPGLDWLSRPEGVLALAAAPLGLRLEGFLAGPSLAFLAVMVVSVWHFLGYQVVVILAGLQNIPREYYEAAQLDGASWWQQHRYITWPLLSPTTFFLATLGLIGAFQVFTQVYILTPTGGVLQDTLTVTFYLYNKGFRDSDFSYASAIAVVVFLAILVLTLWQRRLLERKVNYEV